MDTVGADQSFQRMLLVLRRRAHWVLLCFIIATGAAYGLTKLQTKKYTATADVLFNTSQVAQEAAGLPVPVISSGSQSTVQDTNVFLLQNGDMARLTAAQLDHGLTAGAVAAALKIGPVGDTNVVSITATSKSPKQAAKIANTYSAIFVNEQNNAEHQDAVKALAVIDRQLAKLSPAAAASAQGLGLAGRAQSLQTLAALPSAVARVVATASPPSSPSSPKTKTNVVLGAVLGVLLGLGFVFLLERLDQRIREPKDLEHIYGLPLLGVVPESSALARTGRDRGAAVRLPPQEAEAFHLIRAHLRYFEVDRDLQTLLVASAASGDGKTTVARSLAIAAAQMGSRVLLLEADLRHPTLAKPLGLAPGPGLADVLIGAAPLSEATQLVDVEPPGRELARGRPLAVLLAGAQPPPNPVELLESAAMERVLEQSRVAYDLVVIDTAPLAVVSDSFSLLRKVDGVMIVARIGRSRRDVAQRLRQTLAGGGSPLLGVIANGVKIRRRPPYGYAYEYDNAGPVATPTLS